MERRRERPRLQVLVVDDDEATRSTLMTLVETFGVDVNGAEDGAAAYGAVLDATPDLILCDLRMPVLDGFGFIRRLRREPRFRRILTVAISGLARPVDIARAREAGYDGHILKPIAPEVIARLLDRALDRRIAQDRNLGA
jgi:two-component system CheB/CheR fusion protein